MLRMAGHPRGEQVPGSGREGLGEYWLRWCLSAWGQGATSPSLPLLTWASFLP